MSNPAEFLKPLYKSKSLQGRFSLDSSKSWLDTSNPFIVVDKPLDNEKPYRRSDGFYYIGDHFRSSGESSFEDSFTLILPPIGKKIFKPIRRLNSKNKVSIIPDFLCDR